MNCHAPSFDGGSIDINIQVLGRLPEGLEALGTRGASGYGGTLGKGHEMFSECRCPLELSTASLNPNKSV